jgi:hypothetical protein
MTYAKANWDSSAVTAGSHGEHAPVSVELCRNCRRSETDDCESGSEKEGAHTIASHRCPHSGVELHK